MFNNIQDFWLCITIIAREIYVQVACWSNITVEIFLQQEVVEKNIYIPKEEDRKRTLKETAPPPTRNSDDTSKFSKGLCFHYDFGINVIVFALVEIFEGNWSTIQSGCVFEAFS